jgi:hypothetical protein
VYWLRWLFTVALLLGAGCTPAAQPVLEPTETLIPPTITVTPSPVPATAALTPLPRPGDLVAPTPTANAEGETALDSLAESDPVAAELAALAQRRIAQQLNLPARRVRVVEVAAYAWPDSSLGCPLSGESYAQGVVDGYRIVVAAGEQEFIFHSDFDRVLPCDVENEQLPES